MDHPPYDPHASGSARCTPPDAWPLERPAADAPRLRISALDHSSFCDARSSNRNVRKWPAIHHRCRMEIRAGSATRCWSDHPKNHRFWPAPHPVPVPHRYHFQFGSENCTQSWFDWVYLTQRSDGLLYDNWVVRKHIHIFSLAKKNIGFYDIFCYLLLAAVQTKNKKLNFKQIRSTGRYVCFTQIFFSIMCHKSDTYNLYIFCIYSYITFMQYY